MKTELLTPLTQEESDTLFGGGFAYDIGFALRLCWSCIKGPVDGIICLVQYQPV